MINCRKISQRTYFRPGRAVFQSGAESSEKVVSAPESREELKQKYADNGKRIELYNEAEKAANDVMTSSDASDKAKKAAERVLQLTTTARENERKYGLDPAYFMNEEAASLHRRYSNMLRYTEGGAASEVASKSAKPAEKVAATSETPRPAPAKQGDDMAELAAMDEQMRTDLAKAAGGGISTPTGSGELPAGLQDAVAQPASTTPSLSLGGAGEPVGPIRSETPEPTVASGSSSEAVTAGQAVKVEGPKAVAEPETKQPARREVIDLNRLPPPVKEAYDQYKKNPASNANKVTVGDQVYSFENYQSESGSGDQKVRFSKVKIFVERQS